MTIRLTPEQSARYEAGGWSSCRMEEGVIEALDRQPIAEPVMVLFATGQTAFSVTPLGRIL